MRTINLTNRQRHRAGARFRVGLATMIASSGLFVAATVYSSPSASAASPTVTNCNSRGPGSLAHVVAGAAANSTVTFSVTCSSISVTSPIDVTVPLDIEGPGTSAMELSSPFVDGGNEVFEISPNIDVSVSGLSFQNGDPSIDNQGTLTLSDCEMASDQNQQWAAGISNEGTLMLNNCDLLGNGDYYGYDNNSTGLSNSGTATLSNCTISGNETDDGEQIGAAIDNQGQLTVDSCTFENNTAWYGGGAIHNDGGSLSITGSTISDNTTEDAGPGGILNEAGTMMISDSDVSANYPGGIDNDDSLTVNNSMVDGNQGGGINNGGTLGIIGSTLSGNDNSAINNTGSATITGSNISRNAFAGKHHGGGLINSGTMNIANTTVSYNNSYDGTGGGIYNDGSMSLTDSDVSYNKNAGGGGGIDNARTLTISDSTISKNSLFDGGGPGGAGILNDKKASLVLSTSTLAENQSNSHGGGIENVGGSVVVTASTLAQNTSVKGGGGIENIGGGSATLAATVIAGASPQDCSGVIADAGYNLDDDGSCGFSSANHSSSDVQPYLGPLQDNGGPTKTEEPALGSALLNAVPVGATGNGVTLCPSTDQRGVARPQGSECDMGAVELSPTPQDITSAGDATATAGQPFSFTVTTTGTPVPKLSETGTLPKKLIFTDNGNGTATVSGKAKKAGSSQLVIKATFGNYVVLQVFTLTVTAG